MTASTSAAAARNDSVATHPNEEGVCLGDMGALRSLPDDMGAVVSLRADRSPGGETGAP